jgi:hypothetical protein
LEKKKKKFKRQPAVQATPRPVNCPILESVVGVVIAGLFCFAILAKSQEEGKNRQGCI